MADHLRKNTRYVGDIPLLASAYVKFDPVPEGWEDMVEDFKQWQEKNPDSDSYNHSKLNLLNSAAEVLTRDVGDTVKLNADYRTYLRDGSLILEILITIPLIDLLTEDVKKLIEMAARNEDLDPWKASVVVGDLVAEMVFLERQMKKIGLALTEIIKAIVGRNYVFRPESRIGVLGNFLRFHEHFSAAKISSTSTENRADSMKKALKQIKIIKEVLRRETDRKLVYSYLLIRTRDLAHIDGDADGKEKDIKSYNDCVDKILKIKEDLSDMSF